MWIVVAVVSFAATPHGPLGSFWAPDPMDPSPTSAQLPFFIVLNVIEAVSFASAVALLIFYFPKKAFLNLTIKQTRLSFFSLLWLLGNWWAHDSLHLHNGMNLQGLLYIEYGFHVTLILCASYLFTIVNKLRKSK